MIALSDTTNQVPPKRRDPRLQLTDLVVIGLNSAPGSFYGLLVSQHIYDMLELRTAAVPTENPIMNSTPTAVIKSYPMTMWRTVATREEWLAAVEASKMGLT